MILRLKELLDYMITKYSHFQVSLKSQKKDTNILETDISVFNSRNFLLITR